MGVRMHLIAAPIKELVERRPAPLDLSDKQILDWLGKYSDRTAYTEATQQYSGCFTVFFHEGKASGKGPREAVCLAAAIQKEANRDG